MDYLILISIGVIVLVIGSTMGMFYLYKKNILKPSDIDALDMCFDLSYSILKEIGLCKDPQSKLILETVDIVLDQLKDIDDIQSKEEFIDIAWKNTEILCNQFNLLITPEREIIMKKIILIASNQIFTQRALKNKQN